MPKHGSPADRGKSDAYYGRAHDPHKWPDGRRSSRVELQEGSQEEREYTAAYYSEDDRKKWD